MSDSGVSNPFEELSFDPEELISTYEEITKALIEEKGPHHLEVYVARCFKSLYYLTIGDLVEAAKNVLEVEKECLEVYAEGSLEAEKVHTLVLQCLLKISRLDSSPSTQSAIYELIVRNYGSDHEMSILWRRLLIAFLSANEQFSEAATLAQTQVAACTLTHGENSPETLQARKQLAAMTSKSGHSTLALEMYEILLQDFEKHYGNESTETFECQRDFAQCLLDAEDFEKAKELIENLLKREIQVSGEDHENVHKSQVILAIAFQGLGLSEDAREVLEQVLESQTNLLGEKHQTTLQTRYQFLRLVDEDEDIEELIESYETFISDAEEVLGAKDTLTLQAKLRLSNWYDDNEQYEENVELLEQVVEAFTELLGPDDEFTLDLRCAQANAVHEAGDGIDAAPYYSELIDDLERIKGSTDERTIQMRVNYYRGIMWDEYVSNQIEAMYILEIVLHDLIQVYGAEHPKVKDVAEDLGHYSYAIVSWEPEYLENWQLSLSGLIERYSTLHPGVFRTRLAIVEFAIDAKDYSGAIEQLKVILTDKEKFYGETHIEVMMTREKIADVLLDSGDKSAALAEYQDIEAVCRINGNRDSETYFRVRFKIAKLLQESSSAVEIIQLLNEILSEAEETFGESNNVSIDARILLATLLYENEQLQDAIKVQESVVRDVQIFRGTEPGADRNVRKQLEGWKIQFISDSLGQDNLEVLSATYKFAEFLVEIYDWDTAIPVLENLLERQVRILGEHAPELVDTRKLLIYSLRYRSKPKAIE